MAKRMRGCCLGFLLGTVFVFVLIAGGLFFGANYAVNRYLGDDGEFMALGIKNIFQLVDFINAVGKEPDMKGIIHSESAPSDGAKADALEKLKEFGFPMKDDGSGNLTPDIDKLLSGGIDLSDMPEILEIELTGAEFASLVNMALVSGAQGSANLYGMKLEQTHLGYVSDDECDITLTLSLPLEEARAAMGALASFLTAGKIYMTCVNTMTVAREGGEDRINVGPKGDGGIRLNTLSETQSSQLFTAFLAMAGGGSETPKSYCQSLGNMIADAINNFKGPKSFVKHADGDETKPAAVKLGWAQSAV